MLFGVAISEWRIECCAVIWTVPSTIISAIRSQSFVHSGVLVECTHLDDLALINGFPDLSAGSRSNEKAKPQPEDAPVRSVAGF